MSYKSRVLVVEDNPIERENLGDLLMSQAYDVALAINGREALVKAVNFMPDLILLDVMMPGMDGFEVCQRLRADPVTAEVPIIMLTALNDRIMRLHGLEAGADDFISKPFDMVELLTRVQTITRLNRYRRLMAERTMFEQVVERSEDGYLLINDQDKITFANRAALQFLGLSEDSSQPVVASFLAVAEKHYHRQPEEAWVDWPEQVPEGMLRYLLRPETPTAHALWLQVTLLDYLPAGPEPVWIISLQNVTEQIVLRQSMRTFQSAVGHKLRTPLNNMLASLEILTAQRENLSRAEAAEFTEFLFEGVKRLYEDIEMVTRYMDAPALAQSESGFNLAQLQPTITEICADLAVGPIVIHVPEDVLAFSVVLSASAMELVLREILENAKKFHPQQQPAIEVSVIRFAEEEVTIQVSDNGLTLAPEQLRQVWTSYYQGEKYFTGEVAGMGLGLSIVASLVWSVNGRYRMANRTQGAGVTIEISLPLAKVGKKDG